ncbi:MAG: S-layer homology domain-containing protein [Clostridia bacterium]|nr:S-layer homology domain-containing protein [Clostridia bacterium]
MKKLVTLIIIAVILFTTTICSNAAYFSDVSIYLEDNILNAINYMSDNGHMTGSGDGTFGLDTPVTRSVFVTVLFRYSGDTGTFSHPFTDVPANQYYSNAVGWAYQNGITDGTGGNTFSPDLILTREQLVRMLKNYSVYKNKYVSPGSAVNLSSYNDGSNVSDFATVAVQWSILNHILQPQESRIGPKDTVTRTILAVYIHRYSIFIDKIDHTKDVFNFNNSSDHFENTYFVSEDDKDLINQALCAYYGANFIPSDQMTSIVNWYSRAWTGSCHGMALSVALDKLGIIALNENYDTNKATMNAVSSPSVNASVESIINVYQVTQSLNILPYNSYEKSNITAYKAGLTAFIADLKQNGIALFDYFAKNSSGTYGHALVAYDITRVTGPIHKVLAYDCNSPTQPVVITINPNTGGCSIQGNSDIIHAFKYTCDFSMYKDYLDFDGIYNDKNVSFINNNPPVNSVISNDPARIKVYKYDDYGIGSEDLGSIVVSDGIASGYMEILNHNYSVGGSPNSLCTDEYTVDISNCYELKYDENKANCLFEIYHEEYNVIVEAENTNRIMATTSSYSGLRRWVKIFSAANSNFRVLYKIDNSFYDFVIIEGISNGTSEVLFTNNDVTLNGITGNITVTYIDYDTFEETTLTVNNNSSSSTIIYPTES